MAEPLSLDDAALVDDDPDLGAVIKAIVEARLSRFHVSMPALIINYDKLRQRAVVQPLGSIRETDPDTGEDVVRKLPRVPDVPVVFQQSRGFGVTFPLEPGDEVLLVVSSTPTGAWRGGAGYEAEPAGRRGQLSNAFAIPGVSAAPLLQRAGADSALVLHGDDVRLNTPTAARRVVTEDVAQALRSILLGAADGVGYGSAVKSAINSTGWPNVTSKVRVE